MNTTQEMKPVEILVVEDSGADANMLADTLRRSSVRCRLSIVADGSDAMMFLKRQGRFAAAPRPAMVILDLSIPVKDGTEVLVEMKSDNQLRSIPVIILTATDNTHSVTRMYRMCASCYVVKPVDIDQLNAKMRAINDFWLRRVKLPAVN